MTFVLHDVGMEETDVGGTACRRSHDIVVLGEETVVALCQTPGFLLKTGVAHRLSAAGLTLGIIDIQTEARQQTVGRDTHFGIEGVNITWYE